MTSYTFPTVSEALPVILRNLLEQGDEVGSRNGRVMEFLNTQIVITDPTRREVLSLNRKANVFAQIAETMWVLSGRSDVEWLSAYLPRAKDYSDDGVSWRAGYGPRIRNHRGVDQLSRAVEMLRHDPLTRQAVIQIWDVTDGSLESLKDRACNTQIQFHSRFGRLHMTVTVRSNDVMWGWSGINAFEWSTMQEIVASLLGIKVGTLTFNIGSLHLYDIHWDKAKQIEFEGRWATSHDPVAFNPYGDITTMDEVDLLLDRWFVWEAMCRSGEATQELLDEWEEPLFRTWAAAIAYYWMRDEDWLKSLQDTPLAAAIALTPASVFPEPVQRPESAPVAPTPTSRLNENVRAFYDFVTNLHAVKHASYGDSWKKRGEKLSILANIARKVDRLGVSDAFDSSADTLIDLFVYTAKYLCWLEGREAGPDEVDPRIQWALNETKWWRPGDLSDISRDWDFYMYEVDSLGDRQKHDFVLSMLKRTAPCARDLWLDEQDEQDDSYRGADRD